MPRKRTRSITGPSTRSYRANCQQPTGPPRRCLGINLRVRAANPAVDRRLEAHIFDRARLPPCRRSAQDSGISVLRHQTGIVRGDQQTGDRWNGPCRRYCVRRFSEREGPVMESFYSSPASTSLDPETGVETGKSITDTAAIPERQPTDSGVKTIRRRSTLGNPLVVG